MAQELVQVRFFHPGIGLPCHDGHIDIGCPAGVKNTLNVAGGICQSFDAPDILLKGIPVAEPVQTGVVGFAVWFIGNKAAVGAARNVQKNRIIFLQQMLGHKTGAIGKLCAVDYAGGAGADHLKILIASALVRRHKPVLFVQEFTDKYHSNQQLFLQFRITGCSIRFVKVVLSAGSQKSRKSAIWSRNRRSGSGSAAQLRMNQSNGFRG